ncbi:MAG: hypothetical protein HYV95_11640 [Opitutae bacterium]|nr:hypothetical protein [Opitutae bacterium]
MKNDISRKATEIEQKLNSYQVEELESRFEMLSIGNSQCTSSCGTEAK